MNRWPYVGIAGVIAALLVAISVDGAPWWLSLGLMMGWVVVVRIAYAVRE